MQMGEKDDTKQEAQVKKVVDANVTKKVDEGPITVILKLDLHCDGCAKKVKNSVRYIQGVESVKADSTSNKLTIVGKVDPMHIKDRVEFKTKKKVELISPKPKKDDEGVKKDDDKPAETKSNDQRPKEPVQSTMVVLKIPLHCDGCIQKIKRIILKIDGVESVKPDSNENLVTVKGTMNTKELIPYLKDKLKRDVVVPPKKEDNKVQVEANDKKENEDSKNKKNDPENHITGAENKKTNGKMKMINSDEDSKNKKNDPENHITGAENKKTDGKIKMKMKMTNSDGDVMNKSEYYRDNSYTYTMAVYNQSYHNQDYGVPVSSSNGYGNGNEGYGYGVQYSRGPPPPPSPMSIHNPHASEPDMLSEENANACLIM